MTTTTLIKTEGPTDLLALLSMGLPPNHRAFSTPFGCDENPTPETLSLFRGSKALIIHDADTPGQRGAEKWAPAVSYITAETGHTTKNVQLPYPIAENHGKDLRDFFNEGGTVESLLQLAEQTEVTTPSPITNAPSVGQGRSDIHGHSDSDAASYEDRPATSGSPHDNHSHLNESIDDPHRLARLNLQKLRANNRDLRYWRDEWYVWKEDHYRRNTQAEFRAKLTQSIKEEFDRCHAEEMSYWRQFGGDSEPPKLKRVTHHLVSDVMQATAGMIIASDSAEPVSIFSLVEQCPELDPPVIDRLIRRGETGNIIAASKTGKSWLAYNIALCAVSGRPIFDHFETQHCGRVLIIDNEVRRKTLAKRIPDVAAALGVHPREYSDKLDILPLRGCSVDFYQLAAILDKYPPGKYDLIIADAWYRFLPDGVSENDNAQVAQLYNLIDTTTERLNAAWLNIHHSSKGGQGEKAVTDVGAGAGAQSRAADTHIVLRPHEDDGVFVLEAAVRSFPPLEPLALTWEYPVWKSREGVDTKKLRDRGTSKERQQAERDNGGKVAILETLQDAPSTERVLRDKTKLSRDRCRRLLNQLMEDGKIDQKEVMVHGNQTWEYFVLDGVVDDESTTIPTTGEGGGVVGPLTGRPTDHPSPAPHEIDYQW